MLELFYFAYLAQSSVAETQKALAEADAAAKSRGAFLANMSHEIRTPMNGMIGLIEVMEATDEDKRHARSIGMIRNSAFSLLRILNDILDASQIDSGKLQVERTKVELHPLIEGATQTLQSMADTHQVTLRVLVNPELPEWIWSDSGRLRQILLNLLSNAVKYSAKRLTGRQGSVYMDVSKGDGDTIAITITDNGTGISDEVRATLFQPFSNGDLKSRSLVGGTGLGLSITRSLIGLLGGHIRFDTHMTQGTRVRVDLPLEAADGPKRTPDLTGVNIICFDILDDDARAGLSRIIEGAGATLHVVRTLADLGMLLPLAGPEPVFLLPNPDDAIAGPLAQDLRTLLPDARVIRFSASREARYGLLDDQTYQIQIFPMMGSEFMRAMAVLGGRLPATEAGPLHSHADPRPQDTRTEITQDSITSGRADADKPMQNCKILLVEDNQINRMVLSKQLDLMGYPHDVAAHGEEGFEAWQAGNYDLILSDCHMPIMDGFEMTHKIREMEQQHALTHTPIIAITANALEGEGDRCRAQGMDDYLAKPVEMNKLRLLLQHHLAAPQNGQAPQPPVVASDA
nr:ATP-binding protein [Thalassobius sp. Cn5-15]